MSASTTQISLGADESIVLPEPSLVDVDEVEPDEKEELNLVNLTLAHGKQFWQRFVELEPLITEELKTEHFDSAMGTICKTARAIGFLVEFRLGIDRWNGTSLPERKNTIEMVLSANWNRNLCDQVDILYKTQANLPEYWGVSKYCITNGKMLSQMHVEVSGTVVCNSDDIKYAAVPSKTDLRKLDLILYVPPEVRNVFVDTGPVPDDKGVVSYEVTCSSMLMQLMHNLIGEFHILHTLGEIVMCQEQPGDIELRHAKHAKAEMDATALAGVHPECDRCKIRAYNHHLRRCIRCKKAYYCSVRCQKADRSAHKLVCSK
jgi:hypothetical protein